jgi:RNA polymerase sigma-70 factor, ECF subfamily
MVVPKTDPDPLREIYQREGRRVFATLVRLLNSFELAEDALHNAFIAAAERWPREGMPKNPVAWLVSAGRFKAIDQLRRQQRMTSWGDAAEQVDRIADRAPAPDEREAVEDDRLQLIFTCCHPSLSEEACVALTLREGCGLTTEAIAHACLQTPATLAQRIVRAKAKIRDAGIPYQVPDTDELSARLRNVLRVIYLVFNEGYSASSGEDLLKPDLSTEAIRLARLLSNLLPEPEVQGLLALLLLQDSRRSARITPSGDLIPLEEQDRGHYEAAKHDRRARCGDTGVPRWYVKIGNEARVEGGPVALEAGLRRGTATATHDVPLHPNRVHPLWRTDYNNNVGIGAPEVEYSFHPDADWRRP